jgi:hypothetical protein
MLDAIDSLLNNAVDFYVQVVDYRRISTSQILTPVGAGIRQPSPDFGDTVLDSGQSGWNLSGATGSPAIWPDLVGILDGSGRSGRISGQSALDLARTTISDKSDRDPPRTVGSRPAGRIPATFAEICMCQI